ncbi:MAG: MG2 domain-containing protein, partial [Pseudomonadota bacterium]
MKQILQSIRGQMLWEYYKENRRHFSRRSNVIEIEQDNVLTWDLRTLVQETIIAYQASLHEHKVLQKISLAQVEDILVVQPDTRRLRPTLYDFLAHRALEFFVNSEPDLTKPAISFELNKAEYFAPASRFIEMAVVTPDELATKFYAVKTLQVLLAFHQDDVERSAYADADADADRVRLKFIHTYSSLENKDQLYLDALFQLREEIKSDPAFADISHTIAQRYLETAKKWTPDAKKSTHQEDLIKAVVVCEEAIQKFPKATGSVFCKNLQEHVLIPDIRPTVESDNPSNKPFRIKLEYKNVETAFVRIIALDNGRYSEVRQMYRDNVDMRVRFLLSKPPLWEGSFQLNETNDYRKYTTELPMQGMTYGDYVVLVSNTPGMNIDEGIVGFAHFTVTDIDILQSYNLDGGPVELLIVDRNSGQLIKPDMINLYLDNSNSNSNEDHEVQEASISVSEQSGSFEFKDYHSEKFNIKFSSEKTGHIKLERENSDSSESARLSIEVINEQDSYEDLFFLDNAYSSRSKVNIDTHFFLDRSIYRPGQTAYFKGLMTHTENKQTQILPHYTSNVFLYNANRKQIAQMTLTTNAYGSFAGSFELPQNGLTGTWSIRSENDRKSFSVEEYKRPKFEVVFDSLDDNYRLGETVQLSGRAIAFGGYNIAGSAVKYAVTRRFQYPPWQPNHIRRSRRSALISQGETTTDATGVFQIAFDMLPHPKITKDEEGYFTFEIDVDVTDLTGET